ncbi:sodium:solute symporter family protein [Pseudalkalibacillus sp. R45]|uniref:sodium:solute symporter family protein n=1 Tax=Pseudalkalibacillus sp. R45 TaxID=3457433 RepID=UPI003FCDEE88
MENAIVTYSWIIMSVFLLGMVLFGYFGMKKTKNSDDFATARSSYGPLTVALVIAAGVSSGSTFMGMPGLAYDLGTPSLWYPLLYPIATVFGMLFVAKAIKRYGDEFGTRTIPEFLGDRFNSEFLRIVLTIISILLIFYVVSQFVAAATMFQTMMGVKYEVGLFITGIVLAVYVFMGGSHSDIMTDAVQGFLMVITAIVVLVCFLLSVGVEGNFSDMIQLIKERNPTGAFDQLFLPGDKTYGAFWLVALLFVAHLPFSVLPHLGNKFMAVRSNKEMKKLIMWCTIFATILPLMGLGGMLGIAVVDPGANIAPDQIIPVLFSEIFPPFVAAFFAVAVLSAVMSTSDGLIVSLTQLLANDLYRKTIVPRIKISKEKAERNELLISRYSTFLVIIAGIMFAWSPPKFLSVFMWIGIGGIVSATAGPLIVGGLWKRATKKGAIFSLLSGTLTYWFVYLPFGLNFTNPFGAAGLGVLVGMITMFVYTKLATPVVSKESDERLTG